MSERSQLLTHPQVKKSTQDQVLTPAAQNAHDGSIYSEVHALYITMFIHI